jgi:hypothetical protein
LIEQGVDTDADADDEKDKASPALNETQTQPPDDEEQAAEESDPTLADLIEQGVEDSEVLSSNGTVAEGGGQDDDGQQEPGLKDLLYQGMDAWSNNYNYTEGTLEFEGESGDMEMPIEVLNMTDTEITEEEEVDTDDYTNEVGTSVETPEETAEETVPVSADEEQATNPPQQEEEEEEDTDPPEANEATAPPDGTDTVTLPPTGNSGIGNDIGTPTGSDWDAPAPAFTLPPGTLDCDLMCQTKEHPYVVYTLLAFVPLLLILCCRRYCCADKFKDSRGRYSTIAAQYGDMSYDNTFSDDYSAEGGSDDGDDLEESWGKSGGKRVLEMTNISERNNGDLSLEEMNG